jgi:hypothetical protein
MVLFLSKKYLDKMEDEPKKIVHKDCRECDFCLIKKELSRLNSKIICPTKAKAKASTSSPPAIATSTTTIDLPVKKRKQ